MNFTSHRLTASPLNSDPFLTRLANKRAVGMGNVVDHVASACGVECFLEDVTGGLFAIVRHILASIGRKMQCAHSMWLRASCMCCEFSFFYFCCGALFWSGQHAVNNFGICCQNENTLVDFTERNNLKK